MSTWVPTYENVSGNFMPQELMGNYFTSIDELFNIEPEKFKEDISSFNIPDTLSEQEVFDRLCKIGIKNNEDA